jgi:hypothetical protein
MFNIDQTSTAQKLHDPWVSCERVFEVSAEMACLIEEQNALFGSSSLLDMSPEALAGCAQRHARIGQLSEELKKLSNFLFQFAKPKAESIN